MYDRYLKLKLKQGDSAFLWGARKSGKSTYLQALYPNSVRFNLLNQESQLRYLKEPFMFREDVLKLDPSKLVDPIIVDEVQKVPAIMDEIHLLIEEKKLGFILCGSSTRKMRRAGVNLLGGRALKYHFYPLVYPEIKDDFDLIKIFNNGLIPQHYLANDARIRITSYIGDYLISEIKEEALVRNLAMFTRFFDSVAFSHGEIINYTNIARDVGISSVTVKDHYQILVDTLIGYLVDPYRKKIGREIISASPKFYLFDVGVANRLTERSFQNAKGAEAGRALEHYIFLELLAYTKLNLFDHKISYWRTKTGVEVDFIAHTKRGEPIPIEVKISENVHKTELKGMKAFMKEHQVKTGYIVCMDFIGRKVTVDEGEIIILPVKEFLERLWAQEIFKDIL